VTTINEAGEEQQWTARYRRHWADGQEVTDSLIDAYAWLYYGLENGDLYPVDIIGPDGQTAMTHEVIMEAIYANVQPEALEVHLESQRAIGGVP
jgi:hypothetical protein